MQWLKRIFGNPKETSDAQRLVSAASSLVAAYGEALEVHANSGSMFSDTSALPAEKETIKAALKLLLRVSTDSQKSEQLRAAYLMLADFQPGIGDQILALDVGEPPPHDGDVQGYAARVVEQMDNLQMWQTKAGAELDVLLAELQAEGA